jgi:hypothetical protein
LRAKLLENGTRCIKFHPCCIVVTQRPARRADLDPGTRSLVRRIDLLPQRPRPPQQRQRAFRVILGKSELTRGMGDQRRHVGRLDRLRVLVEVSNCRPTRIDGSGG